MMKLDGKLLLCGIPVIAIIAIALIQSYYGGLAPAPPVSIPDRTARAVEPRLREPQPTVLAPSAESRLLPPGGEAEETVRGIPTLDAEDPSTESIAPSDLLPIPALRRGNGPSGDSAGSLN